jgi:hypothetical protein
MEKISEELSALIASLVRQGFETEGEILEQAFEYAADECDNPEELEPEIKQLTADLLIAHQAEQQTWEAVTDCDRLDRAFASLNAQGIVARQHFSCCNTCGHAEIWEEVEAEETNHPVQGYVFYHFQSTENAVDAGKLYLTYGTVEENEQALARVAERCVAELRHSGLNATWGGDSYSAILVDGIVWQKRRE